MGLPPSHKVDHTPRVVLSMDSSWDNDRFGRELAAIRGEAEATADEQRDACAKESDHPLVRYLNGTARCDLDTVREYLDPADPPVIFTLRRMTLQQWLIYSDESQARPKSAQGLALRICFASVDGAEIKLNRGGSEHGRLDDGDMDRLRALTGDTGFLELGRQAVACSRELLEDEKKP